MRGYNLYFDLQESARLRKQAHLQMAAWRPGLALSDSFSDPSLRPMAHFMMGNAANSAAQPKLAEEELSKASRLVASAPPIRSTRVAFIEAQTRLAEVEIELGKLRQASARLENLEPEVAQLSDNFLSILFYTNLGTAQIRLNDEQKAESSLRSAINLAELSLRSFSDERTKLELSQKSSLAYRNLVQLNLHETDIPGSFEIWE